MQRKKERGEEAVLLGQLYRDRLQRENKLDTGEDKNRWVEPAIQSSERTWKGELILKQVSEMENILGLD